MERLTEKCWRNLDPWECCGQDNYCQRGCYEEGGCAKGCIVPKLYSRLAQYEDAGLEPEEVEMVKAVLIGRELAKITEINDIPLSRLIELARFEKDNAPLTIEELRKMDGQPVWLKDGRCFIIECRSNMAFDQHGLNSSLDILADIGLFRCKPEASQ